MGVTLADNAKGRETQTVTESRKYDDPSPMNSIFLQPADSYCSNVKEK